MILHKECFRIVAIISTHKKKSHKQLFDLLQSRHEYRNGMQWNETKQNMCINNNNKYEISECVELI